MLETSKEPVEMYPAGDEIVSATCNAFAEMQGAIRQFNEGIAANQPPYQFFLSVSANTISLTVVNPPADWRTEITALGRKQLR